MLLNIFRGHVARVARFSVLSLVSGSCLVVFDRVWSCLVVSGRVWSCLARVWLVSLLSRAIRLVFGFRHDRSVLALAARWYCDFY